jgi:hypothetical protein
MNNEIKQYTVEVNINFCFYVDVEANSIEEAQEVAYERASNKADELAGDLRLCSAPNRDCHG